MLAVLDEAMRLHAPVPATTPRTINELGDTIAGYYVPPGVSPTSRFICKSKNIF
jgi:cytochrome P450